jgi:IS4 transposase
METLSTLQIQVSNSNSNKEPTTLMATLKTMRVDLIQIILLLTLLSNSNKKRRRNSYPLKKFVL